MRRALYHRVSTVHQDQALAREALRTYAHRVGATVTLEVEETGSGARNDRPGLQRVLAAARAGEIDGVVVWKLDRFGRSALDLIANIRMLADDYGCEFIAMTQGIHVKPNGDAMSRLTLNMLSAIAEFERDLIIERTRAGLARARARGKRLGRPKVKTSQKVLKLAAQGLPEAKIATALKMSMWAVRQSKRLK